MWPLDIGKYPLVLLVGYLVAFALTPLIGLAAQELGIVDEVGPRRIHRSPTPRAGGIAIFIGFHTASTVLFIHPWYREINGLFSRPWWPAFILASSLLLIVGLIDDVKNVTPWIKLSGQLAAGLIMYAADIQVKTLLGFPLPPSATLVLTLLWFIAITNAFNLIDGYDGLAAGLASIAALGVGGTFIYRHMPLEALLLLGFIGSCCGFLRYNIYPARIFLGDSGSMFLGFTLASVTLATSAKGTLLASMWVPLLALGVPMLDVMLAIWRRSAKRLLALFNDSEKSGGIMDADLQHLHHRLAAQGVSPRNVTAILYLVNSVLVLLGLLSIAYQSVAHACLLGILLGLIFVVVRLGASIEISDSKAVLVYAFAERRMRKNLTVALHAFLDLIGLSLTLFIAVWLVNSGSPLQWSINRWLELLPLWAGIPSLCLFLLEVAYRWRRLHSIPAKRSRLPSLFVGIIFAAFFSLILLDDAPVKMITQAVIFFFLSFIYILGIRLAWAVLEKLSSANAFSKQ